MIRVLHVISDTVIGGAGRSLCNMLSCADREKFNIKVVLPRGSMLAPKIRNLGFAVSEIQFGADCSWDLRAVFALRAIIRDDRPHILHTHSALYGRVAGLLCHVPVAINSRHCAAEGEHPSPLMQLICGGTERLFRSHTIATADYVKNFLIQRGIPQDTIHIIHNGSRPLPKISDAEKEQTRQKFGLSRENFAVGMVARLENGKGHDTFLHAAKICISKSPNMRFFIVGIGSIFHETKKLAAELGVSSNVIFTGFLSDVTPIMSILDLNINCSTLSETSSLSLSEGMSVGVVPVVSRCGGNPYMTDFGKCGVIFPKGDAAALAHVILDLEAHPEKRQALSEACLHHFTENLTAKAMTARVESLYRQLLRQKLEDRTP